MNRVTMVMCKLCGGQPRLIEWPTLANGSKPHTLECSKDCGNKVAGNKCWEQSKTIWNESNTPNP